MRIIEFFRALWRKPVRLALIGFPVLLIAVPLYLIPVAGPGLAISFGAVGSALMLIGLIRDQMLQNAIR